MTNAPSAGSYDFADYLGVLGRRWRTILGFALAGLLAAAAYVVVAPKTYTATALVYVETNAANSEQLLGSKSITYVNMDNEAQIVTSTSVARRAVALLRTSARPKDLVQDVTVAVPANTQLMQISCSASSPAGASRCANAFANGYLLVRKATAQSKIASDISTFQLELKKLENQLQQVETQIAGLRTNSTAYIEAHARLANLSTRIAPLRAQIASMGAQNNFAAGYIATSASPPSTPSSPRKLLYGPSGLMAGLLIGLGLAFFADRRDDRLHGPGDVERFTGLPVLATFDQRPPDFDSALTAPSSAQGRTFTEVSRVIVNALGDGNQTLLVCGSPDAGQVALNLAAALARTQAEVLLVLADGLNQSAPVLALSGLDAKRGLGAVAAGAATVADVARPFPGHPKLRVIAAEGGLDLFEELPAETVTRLARDFHATARYVVIAAEAPGGSGLIALAEFAKSAVIVADVGKSHRADIMLAVRRLAQMRSRVLGAIVLPPPGRLSKAERRAYEAEQARQPQAAAYRAEPAARGPEPAGMPGRLATERAPSRPPSERAPSRLPSERAPSRLPSERGSSRPAADRPATRTSADRGSSILPGERSPRPPGERVASLSALDRAAARPAPERTASRDAASDQGAAAARPAETPSPTAAFLEEYSRRATSAGAAGSAAGKDRAERPPRPSSQTWPLPRVLMPDATEDAPRKSAGGTPPPATKDKD